MRSSLQQKKDIVFLCDALAVGLRQGLSLVRLLEISRTLVTQKELQRALRAVHADVCEGKTLGQAFAQQRVFDPIFSEMVAAGEASGRLEDIFEHLKTYYLWHITFRSQVSETLAYPLMVLGVLLIALGLLIFFVAPEMLGLMDVIQVAPPLSLQITMGLGKVFFLTLGLGLLATLIMLLFGRTSHVVMSPIRRLVQHYPLGHFLKLTGILYESGLLLPRCFTLAYQAMPGRRLFPDYAHTGAAIEQGQPVADFFQKTNLPPYVREMIVIAQETGTLAENLQKAGDFLLKEGQRRFEMLVKYLQIALIGGAVLVLLTIIVGIIYPVYGVLLSQGAV